MGLTRESIGRISVVLDYPRGDNSGSDQLVFVCRRRTNGEAKATLGDEVMAEKSPAEKNLDWLAETLIETPQGLDDFPTDGPLDQRVRYYFGDPEMAEIVSHVVNRYYRLVLPEQLFRTL